MNRMDDKYIDQHNVIERYLQQKLTREEKAELEVYLLDKPELLEQLELDSIMKEHLPSVQEHTTSNNVLVDSEVLVPWWQAIWAKPLLTSTLSFVFGVVVVLLINGNNDGSAPYSGTIDLIEVSPLRSSPAQGTPDATYSLSSNADRLMLLLQPGFIESETVIVTIKKRSNNTYLFNEQMNINGQGDVVVYLDKAKFEPGAFDIDIRPIGQPNDLSPLWIEITP